MVPILKNIKKMSEKSILKSKFRGCLLGSLAGDCAGAPYEGCEISASEKVTIQKYYFDKLEDPKFTAPVKQYTDDTAMTKSVAQFLIDKREADYKFLAELFTTEYFSDPERGYGQSVVEVFQKLRENNFESVFTAATEQFSGEGSYGNGGAMRVAPIALYFHDNYDSMIETATNATKITHSNPLGINGALLQCMAISQALLCNPKDKIDVESFCSELSNKIREIEKNQDYGVPDFNEAYYRKLQVVKDLLGKIEHDDELDNEVILNLGHGISAYESVPTAIYCFLKAQNKIPYIETENIYRRTIQYAISLGGDTDTIASMAGAIAGAYLGEQSINPVLAKRCEFYKEVLEIADRLLDAREAFLTKIES